MLLCSLALAYDPAIALSSLCATKAMTVDQYIAPNSSQNYPLEPLLVQLASSH